MAATLTEVMVGFCTAIVTVIVADPVLVESSVDVAMHVAFPAPLGVNNPEVEMDPPVALHVTAEL